MIMFIGYNSSIFSQKPYQQKTTLPEEIIVDLDWSGICTGSFILKIDQVL